MAVKDEPRDAFARRLSMWLKHNGHDYIWLAEQVEVSRSTAWKWVLGLGEPRLYTLRRIAYLVGDSFLWMIGVDDG